MNNEFQHRTISAGISRLRLLNRHADMLMQAYAGHGIDENAIAENALKQLLSARVLWRSDEDGSLRISHKFRELMAEMIADEERRQTHADVAESLDELRHLANRYLEAQHKSDYAGLEHIQQRLVNEVDDFNSRFADAIDSLWQRLNSDFGFVQRLDDKIKENQRAQQQVERLLDGLALIDFDEWIETTGGHGFLRRLLVSQWQHQTGQHLSSLRLVQDRLLELITRFRQQQASAKLVRGMAHFLRSQTKYQPHAYHHRSQVPKAFNVAASLPLPAHPQITQSSHQTAVLELFAKLPKHQQKTELPAAAEAVEVEEMDAVAPMQQAVKKAAEDFYMLAVERHGEPLSAVEFWQQQGHEWPADIWLFQVLSEYQGLRINERNYFQLQPTETAASSTNQLLLVRDYVLRMVAHGD